MHSSTCVSLGTDCSVICVFTVDKFPCLGCCACDLWLSQWMSWAMHSCCCLGEQRAGSTHAPIQKEAPYYVLLARDMGQLTVLSPIVWKYTNCHLHPTVPCWVSTLHNRSTCLFSCCVLKETNAEWYKKPSVSSLHYVWCVHCKLNKRFGSNQVFVFCFCQWENHYVVFANSQMQLLH